jgi:PPOX class probable F420-dependent enzyme
MSAGIPTRLAPLLDSTAVALVSTIGPKGEPQTTPIWFIWKDGAVHFSLVDGRQKLRNLRRDPHASVVIVDPAEPTRYLELRGRVRLVADPQLALDGAADCPNRTPVPRVLQSIRENTDTRRRGRRAMIVRQVRPLARFEGRQH